MRKRAKAAALALSLTALAASAGPFLPAVVAQGSRHDQSFNEMAYAGADRFSRQTGTRYLELQVMNDAQRVQALRALARRGATLIVSVGFAFAPAVETVAREFPAVRFTIVDTVARGANVQSIVFREQEGAFLVGMAAALKSRTHRIGFIGGMEVPIIQAFGCGFAQGARHVDAGVGLVRNWVGSTPQAFSDPGRGAELARSQFDRGVDVVFSAAAGTTLGILQQARASGKLAIGVDSNQNGLFPGTILTSMVKRVDHAVYRALLAGRDGRWHAGVSSLGLREDGVGWALDRHNRALVTPAMERRIEAARAAIATGRLKVVDYRRALRCPVS